LLLLINSRKENLHIFAFPLNIHVTFFQLRKVR
jgi:hypothetical protein